MLSRVECVQLCPIIELYGIPPATASHFKWINIKRLTSLLLIQAMICNEVQPSGKIKTNKSESDTSTKLRELNQLYKEGVLTKKEFTDAKKKHLT